MPAGITSQYGFLYQRYAFINLALNHVGVDKFFVYEGADDIDIAEESQISAIKEYNNQFIQVKSGFVSKDCWAKVIGNWLLIEDDTPTYRIILENELTFDFRSDDVLNSVITYFTVGKNKSHTSIANKVYKKYIEGVDESELKKKINKLIDQITLEVISMEQLYTTIKKTYIDNFCTDIIQYEVAKTCRCDRFIEYINSKIDDAIKKKKSFVLRFADLMGVISNVGVEINDRKYSIDISKMRKRKKPEAEKLVDSDVLREVRQLRLVNSDKGFVIDELVKELLYRDLRDVYSEYSSTMISNIEETAYSNYKSAIYSLPKGATPKNVFDLTTSMNIPLSIVDDSPLYRNGCYVYLTSEETDGSRQISWGDEHE